MRLEAGGTTENPVAMDGLEVKEVDIVVVVLVEDDERGRKC